MQRSSPERFLGEARTIRYKYDIIVHEKENNMYDQCLVCSLESNGAFLLALRPWNNDKHEKQAMGSLPS